MHLHKNGGTNVILSVYVYWCVGLVFDHAREFKCPAIDSLDQELKELMLSHDM